MYPSVTCMLSELGWRPLKERRGISGLKNFYRVVSRAREWEQVKGRYFVRRNHAKKVEIEGRRKAVELYSFVGRTAREWT